jgi:hypothetical protein
MGDKSARILGSGRQALCSGSKSARLTGVFVVLGLTGPAFRILQRCSRCSSVTSHLPSTDIGYSQQPINSSDGYACQPGFVRRNLGEVEGRFYAGKSEVPGTV